MRIQEDRHDGEPWLLWKIGNWTAIDTDWISSIAYSWLSTLGGLWIWRPWRCTDKSLFFNGVLFVRLLLPFGVFFSVRWAETGPRAYLQAGIGWKLNGRFAILFRITGDEASAKGVTGPNYGQAVGWAYGTK